MTWTIERDAAVVYKLRNSNAFGGWANATIREWPSGGSMDINSDWGVYSFVWNATGTKTLREFLIGLDFDYFMKKAAAAGYLEFDEQATRREIKKDIREMRRQGHLTKEEARERFDDLDGVEESGSEHLFIDRLHNAGNWAYEQFDGCPSVVTRERAECRQFWDGPWKELCRVWKEETAALAA